MINNSTIFLDSINYNTRNNTYTLNFMIIVLSEVLIDLIATKEDHESQKLKSDWSWYGIFLSVHRLLVTYVTFDMLYRKIILSHRRPCTAALWCKLQQFPTQSPLPRVWPDESEVVSACRPGAGPGFSSDGGAFRADLCDRWAGARRRVRNLSSCHELCLLHNLKTCRVINQCDFRSLSYCLLKSYSEYVIILTSISRYFNKWYWKCLSLDFGESLQSSC